MRTISTVAQNKLERFLRKSLDAIHIKHLVYKIVILPSQHKALHSLRTIMKNSNPNKAKATGKKILFISLDARHMPKSYLEAAFAKSLQLKGHEVKMILCGQVLSMCTTFHRIDHPPNKWSCNNCFSFSKKFYKITDLPYNTYDDYITKEAVEKNREKIKQMSIEDCEKFVYKNVRVGFHSVTSAYRYYKGEKPSKEDYEKILREELTNAMISVDVAEKAFQQENPDVLVSSHDCYSSWGSFSEYFVKNNIRVIVWWTGGYEKDTLIFDIPKLDEYYRTYMKEIRKNKPLNKEEEKELMKFFERRAKGEAGQNLLFGYTETDKETLEKQFNFKKYNKIYVMFPNVPWDASLLNANKGFDGVYDWISYTMDEFKKKPNEQLIIKIHPSEYKVMESKETVLDYINKTYDSLPENIKIIPPDTTISPYSLLPFTDIGIVYNGTIGLEMAMNNTPVLVTGCTHYADKGFTYDILNREEYSQRISENPKPLKNQQQLAKIYAYFYFIKSFIPNPLVYYNDFRDVGWKFTKLEELQPGRNKFLDHICDYIVNNGIFQNY